jgi:hypothetical protein
LIFHHVEWKAIWQEAVTRQGQVLLQQTRRDYNHSEKKKHHVTDFTYHLGSAKQASDYETATEFLINYIKKTYNYGNDIGLSLEELEPVDASSWKPKMQQFNSKTAASEKRLEESSLKSNSKQTTMNIVSAYKSYTTIRLKPMIYCGKDAPNR